MGRLRPTSVPLALALLATCGCASINSSTAGNVVGATGDSSIVRADDHIYVRRHNGLYVVSTRTGAATRLPNDAFTLESATACAISLELERLDACGGFASKGRELVRIAGCHDGHFMGPRPTDPLFTADCATMFFEYDHQVFATDIATARTAHVASGTLVGLKSR